MGPQKETNVRYFTPALDEDLVYEVDVLYEAVVTTEAGETITALGGSINDEGFWIDKDAILAAERARIRRELNDWIAARRARVVSPVGNLALWESDLRAALDRICPEGKE